VSIRRTVDVFQAIALPDNAVGAVPNGHIISIAGLLDLGSDCLDNSPGNLTDSKPYLDKLNQFS